MITPHNGSREQMLRAFFEEAVCRKRTVIVIGACFPLHASIVQSIAEDYLSFFNKIIIRPRAEHHLYADIMGKEAQEILHQKIAEDPNYIEKLVDEQLESAGHNIVVQTLL